MENDNFLICRDDKSDNIEPFILKVNNKLINRLKYSPVHSNYLLSASAHKNSLIKIINNKYEEINIDDSAQLLIIPELNKNELLFYISEGKDDEDNIDTFMKILKLNLFYQNSLNLFDVKKRMSQILLNLDTFWERFNVSKINLTNSFKLKKFKK